MTNRSTSSLAIFICLVIALAGAEAEVIHVPADQPTIQAGIDAAKDGDEVVLADGVYSGPGNINLNLGTKAITLRSLNGAAACVIDCEWSGHGFIFDQSAGHAPTLKGLAIKRGQATQVMPVTMLPGEQPSGGGILIRKGSPIIRDCEFVHNIAAFGGALAIKQGSPRIGRCRFIGNSAEIGGAVGVEEFVDLPPIEDCLMTGNGAQFGGAVFLGFNDHAVPVVFRRCVIQGNLTEDRGAIHSQFGSPLIVENCLLAWNHGVQAGAAISFVETRLDLINSTITGHTGAAGSGAVHQQGIAWLEIHNCVIADNATGSLGGPLAIVHASHSLIESAGVMLIGEGNIDAEPQFVNAAQGNFRLRPTSPCVDAGANALVPTSLHTDLDGSPRILDGSAAPDGSAVVDMGCYEFVRTRRQLP